MCCRYNVINNWDYVGLCKSFDNGAGHAIAVKVLHFETHTPRTPDSL